MNDAINRQGVIDFINNIEHRALKMSNDNGEDILYKTVLATAKAIRGYCKIVPPAQPEHTCVNCGRTVNNGGWYEDGGTRCPIEEHYALPKDGYCHLWEKRKVWEDGYVKRPEEGEK